MESNTPYREAPQWLLRLQRVLVLSIISAIILASFWILAKCASLFGAAHPIRYSLIVWATLGVALPFYWPWRYRRGWKLQYWWVFFSDFFWNLALGHFALFASMPV